MQAAAVIAALVLALCLLGQALLGQRAEAARVLIGLEPGDQILSVPGESPREEVLCSFQAGAKKKNKNKFGFPYGTFMSASPGIFAGGEGVYPHSFERLGAQHGYHITPVLFDPMAPSTPRSVTLGVVCGPDPGKAGAVHTFMDVPPGSMTTAVARCPGKRKLFAGGFNLFNFTGTGGTYPTQAEAIDAKTWTVSAASFGTKGGQIAAIAYCRKGPGSFSFTEAATTIAPGTAGTVTTPACPKKRPLVAGGFETTPHGALMFGSSAINPNRTYGAEGYNRSGAPATFEAYGYCLNIKKIQESNLP
jgi:hypothetical protein